MVLFATIDCRSCSGRYVTMAAAAWATGSAAAACAVMTFLVLMGVATALVGLLPLAQIGPWAPARWCCCASCRASRPAANGGRGADVGGICAAQPAWLLRIVQADRRPDRARSSPPRAADPDYHPPQTGDDRMGLVIPIPSFVVLMWFGAVIRRTVEESPVFQAMHSARELLRDFARPVHRPQQQKSAHGADLQATPRRRLHPDSPSSSAMASTSLKLAVRPDPAVLPPAASAWFAVTLLGSLMGDWIGRVRTFQIGFVLMVLRSDPDVVPDRHQEHRTRSLSPRSA